LKCLVIVDNIVTKNEARSNDSRVSKYIGYLHNHRFYSIIIVVGIITIAIGTFTDSLGKIFRPFDKNSPTIKDSNDEKIVINITNHKKTIAYNSYGISEETFQDLANELNVTKTALNTFFKIIEHEQVSSEDLKDVLSEIAQKYKNLKRQVNSFSSMSSSANMFKNKARRALNNGNFDKTNNYLNSARQAAMIYLIGKKEPDTSEQVDDENEQTKHECGTSLSCAINMASGNTKTHVEIYIAEADIKRRFWIHPLQINGRTISGQLSYDRIAQFDDKLWFTYDCGVSKAIRIDAIEQGGQRRTVGIAFPWHSNKQKNPSVELVLAKTISHVLPVKQIGWATGTVRIIQGIIERNCLFLLLKERGFLVQ